MHYIFNITCQIFDALEMNCNRYFALEFLMLMGYLTFDMEHFYNENQFVVKSYCTPWILTGYIGSKDWTTLGKVIHNLSISIKRASEMGTEVCLVGSRHYFGKKSITS